MGVRQIVGWGWAEMMARLSQYQGPVIFAWCALIDTDGQWTPLAATVRCGQRAEPRFYTYRRLAFGRETLPAGQAAWKISEGRWLPKGAQAPIPKAYDGAAYRVTEGHDYGPLPPIRAAHIYYFWSWQRPDTFSEAIFDEPLTSDVEPWYPRAADALQELLYGRTRSTRAFDWGARLVVDLPYGRAHLEECDFLEDQGLIVNVAESEAGGAANHVLHAAWQLHPSSPELDRRKIPLSGPGSHTIDLGGTPIYWSVGLLDRFGELVDTFEQYAPRPKVDLEHPLQPLAVAEALDSLDSAWRLVFNAPLFQRPQLSSVADTGLSASGREDLITRLSNLAIVLDAAKVESNLLPPEKASAEGSLFRMKLALGARLPDVDRPAAQDATDELRAVVQLRDAYAHKTTSKTRPDLDTALARLRINYPPDPAVAWETVRRTVVKAAGTIRRALRAQLD